MTTLGRIVVADDAAFGASFLFLGHLPLWYDLPLSWIGIVAWYVSMNAVGVVTIWSALGYPVIDRDRVAVLEPIEPVVLGVAVAVAGVVWLRVADSALGFVGAVAAGCIAVALAGASLRTAWRARS